LFEEDSECVDDSCFTNRRGNQNGKLRKVS
jgi:hypothetical protein